MILLDSTIVVGFLDADDALHEATVAKLREIVHGDTLAASVISYADVTSGAALGHHSQARIERFFDALIKELLPVDRRIAKRAAELRGKHRSLKLPDALILATADLDERVDGALCADSAWPKVKGLGCRVELVRAS